MERDQKILIGIITTILLVAICLCIYLFCFKKNNEIKDAEKFKKEYELLNGEQYVGSDKEFYDYINVNMPDDNIYVYKTAKEILNTLKNGTGVIYLGFPTCPRCRNLIKPLMEVALDNKVSQIYYLNIEDMRDTYEVVNKEVLQSVKGTKEYYELVKLLDNYLDYYTLTDKDGNTYNTGAKRIYASTVITVKNGEIVGFHVSTTDNQDVKKPLTENETKELKKIYDDMIKSIIKENVCSDQGC